MNNKNVEERTLHLQNKNKNKTVANWMPVLWKQVGSEFPKSQSQPLFCPTGYCAKISDGIARNRFHFVFYYFFLVSSNGR